MERPEIRKRIESGMAKMGFIFLAFIITFLLIVVGDKILNWSIVWRQNYTLHHLQGEARKAYALRKLDENLARSLARSRLRLAPDPLQSEFMNVSKEGFRQDIPQNGKANSFKIFIFGGSTTFGTGVADNETFPYYLQQKFNAVKLKRPIQIYNFGQPGYANYQEVYLLVDLLRQGKKPDIVIFYDGFNEESGLMDYLAGDRASGYVETDYYWRPLNNAVITYRDHTFGTMDWLAKLKGFNHLALYLKSKLPARAPMQPADDMTQLLPLVNGQVNTYLKNYAFINVIATAWNLQPYFILQPYKDFQNPKDQKAWYGKKLYQDIMNSTKGGVMDWHSMFDKEHISEIYLDSAHLTAKGNALLAEKLYGLLLNNTRVKQFVGTAEFK